MQERKIRTVKGIILRNHPEIRKVDELFEEPESDIIGSLLSAARRLRYARKHGEDIFGFFDYDVDGICSAAVFQEIVTDMGFVPIDTPDSQSGKQPPRYFIRFPRRFSEGYGVSEKAVDEMPKGALLFTADNGISAYGPVSKAKQAGHTVIVTDHHPLNEGESLPPADILVDPNAGGAEQASDYRFRCGAGLMYELARMLITRKTPLYRCLLFAGIATISDVVPLTGANFRLARNMLSHICDSRYQTAGLHAMLSILDCGTVCTEEDLAFRLIPALNAPGRLYDNGAHMAFDLLTFQGSAPAARRMALQIRDINEKRKEEVETGVALAETEIKTRHMEHDRALVIYRPEFPEGVVGIIAGHLAERYHVPAFVLTKYEAPDKAPYEAGKLYGKGSGRTAGDVDLKSVLTSAKEYLPSFGGHPKAAALTMDLARLDEFREFLNRIVPEQKQPDGPTADLDIREKDIPTVFQDCQTYAPYGEGNPAVRVHIQRAEIQDVRFLGKKHDALKLTLASGVPAIGFGLADTYLRMGTMTAPPDGRSAGNASAYPESIQEDLHGRIITNLPKKLDLYGTLGLNHYTDRTGAVHQMCQVELYAIAPVPKRAATKKQPE